jgi:hypothetical protein
MKILYPLILTVAFFSNAQDAQAEGAMSCPTHVSIDQIRAMREQGSVDIKIAITKGKGSTIQENVKFVPGEGVDEIHTQRPVASKKFESSKALKSATQKGDRIVCTYNYDKIFGRTGEFTIIAGQ